VNKKFFDKEAGHRGRHRAQGRGVGWQLAPPAAAGGVRGGAALLRGTVTLYLSLVVVLPLAAVVWRSPATAGPPSGTAATQPQALAALRSPSRLLLVAAGNVVMGTVIAWVLVRDEFPGKRVVNALIDLPFALPTIVAGITLLALYGESSPFGVNVGYSRLGVVLALAFVTLPFVSARSSRCC
jgi:sulfate transport system permease protein